MMIESDIPIDLDQINRHLPEDITLWAHAPAPLGFKPRFNTLVRHYRYYHPIERGKLDTKAIDQSIKHLIGTHDFSLLSKPDGDRPTIATILNAHVSIRENMLTLDVFGTNFLWKLVRKTVTLLLRIGNREFRPNIVSELINQQTRLPDGIRPAPPEGLLFVEAITPIQMIQHPNALKRIKKQLYDKKIFYFRSFSTIEEITSNFLFDRRLSF
jgi:tRNA pseudouridine38-40 synthase